MRVGVESCSQLHKLLLPDQASRHHSAELALGNHQLVRELYGGCLQLLTLLLLKEPDGADALHTVRK